MHELSIASSLVEGILDFADQKKVKRVLKVRLAIGDLTAVEHEQLRFCFAVITKETVIEDAELEIESVNPLVLCPNCSYRGIPKFWDDAQTHWAIPTLVCPECGKSADAVQGHECAIKSIKFAA